MDHFVTIVHVPFQYLTQHDHINFQDLKRHVDIVQNLNHNVRQRTVVFVVKHQVWVHDGDGSLLLSENSPKVNTRSIAIHIQVRSVVDSSERYDRYGWHTLVFPITSIEINPSLSLVWKPRVGVVVGVRHTLKYLSVCFKSVIPGEVKGEVGVRG